MQSAFLCSEQAVPATHMKLKEPAALSARVAAASNYPEEVTAATNLTEALAISLARSASFLE